MEEIRYRNFSWRTHKKNWSLKRPNVCQFELTFKCDLRCRHCYTDSYNKPIYLKKELDAKEVKLILDKVYKAGVIWVCFTGGDPLTRQDFLDIYSYAKERGFIVTVFTNGYSLTEDTVKYFKRSPPFVIEITLNAVTEGLYEKISQVKGSFDRVMRGINLILQEKLPLKIKTQITRDNLGEAPRIKEFIQGRGLNFRPDVDLHARLNGNLAPCNLRISPKEVLGLNGKKRNADEDCVARNTPHLARRRPQSNLFDCAIGGGDGITVDPYGNTFPCTLIRKPPFNLLKVDVEYALDKLLPLVRNKKFTTGSKCNGCNLREFCRSCPGRAYLEKRDMEAPGEYYCKLAKYFKAAMA